MASFLPEETLAYFDVPVRFSSLSESGFIPTLLDLEWRQTGHLCSHLFQRVASFLLGFRVETGNAAVNGSHLFQRVASFLRAAIVKAIAVQTAKFSSLSESGFIPTM